MKLVYASVVAAITGACAASAQSIPPVELGNGVQYGAPASTDRDDGYTNRDDIFRDRDDDNNRDADDGNSGRDEAYRDQTNGNSGLGDDYNRGYQDGYLDRSREVNQRVASQRAPTEPSITRARFERCSRRYRTFDPASGTYVGFDGYRHYCR